MNAALEKYLDKIDKYLRPLPASERVDIVKEIKGSMLEMEKEQLSAEEILRRLGEPKELAKAYLGDLLSKSTGFSIKRVLTVCAFYSVVGFSGIFVIPVLVILAPVFMACGVICPILGAVKMIDYLLGLGIPYVQYIGISLNGMAELNPVAEFIGTVLIGVVLYWAGKASWKLLVYYCKSVSRTKINLEV